MLIAPAPLLLLGRDPAVELRRWHESDVDQLRAAWSDPTLSAGAPPTNRRSEDHARRWIAGWGERIDRQMALDLVIAERTSTVAAGPGAVLGEVGLAEISPQRRGAVLGYWVAEPHRGKGLATDAVRLVAQWAFSDTVGFDVLGARVDPQNHASIRVLEKAGFSRGGANRDGLDVYFAKRGARRPRSD